MAAEESGNERAPEGKVYVCCGCGKVSRWRYGFDEKGKNDASSGWDERTHRHQSEAAARFVRA